MCEICIALDRELRDLEMDIEAVIDQLGTHDREGQERIAGLTSEIIAACALYAKHRAKCGTSGSPFWLNRPKQPGTAMLDK